QYHVQHYGPANHHSYLGPQVTANEASDADARYVNDARYVSDATGLPRGGSRWCLIETRLKSSMPRACPVVPHVGVYVSAMSSLLPSPLYSGERGRG